MSRRPKNDAASRPGAAREEETRRMMGRRLGRHLAGEERRPQTDAVRAPGGHSRSRYRTTTTTTTTTSARTARAAHSIDRNGAAAPSSAGSFDLLVPAPPHSRMKTRMTRRAGRTDAVRLTVNPARRGRGVASPPPGPGRNLLSYSTAPAVRPPEAKDEEGTRTPAADGRASPKGERPRPPEAGEREGGHAARRGAVRRRRW